MLEKIEENILKYSLLSSDENVIVGFSGGADSAFLLYALHKLNYNVYALHINHGIRGEEAQRDAVFARNFCLKYNIKFFEEKVDVPEIAKQNNLSLETAARQERYKILGNYALKFNAKIAVAHNKNDQAETVLMHLLRGSGLNGLCGMQFRNNNIIRPIVNISREEIESYNSENNIDFITDSTNLSCEYTRNKFRLDIIPHIDSALNIDSVSSITKCAEILNDYNNFIKFSVSEYEKQYITHLNDKVIFKINNLPHILQIELIKKCIELLNGNIIDIERTHLEDVVSLLKKESGKEIHLPYNIKAKKIYDEIHFSKLETNFIAEYVFNENETYKWNNGNITSNFVTSYIKEKNCEFLDYDELPKDIVLRTRKEHDYIHPLGSNGKCTLKKYFIDKKVPSDIRNSLPLIAKDNEIYAIIGYTVSEKAKIKSTTKNIIKIIYET